jgi:hypothetical protein
MAELVHPAQRVALEQRTQHAHQQRRQHQRHPEAEHAGERVGHVGAHHVEAGVREVQHAHHAEDQRQPELSMNSSRPELSPLRMLMRT